MAVEAFSTGTELPTDPAERVRAILERVVDALDLDARIEVDEDADEITARLEGDDLGVLIGRRGQTIDAVQLICYRAAFAGVRTVAFPASSVIASATCKYSAVTRTCAPATG